MKLSNRNIFFIALPFISLIFIILIHFNSLREENKKLEIEARNYKESQIRVVKLLSEYEDLITNNKDMAIELKLVVNELKRAIYE